MAKGSQPNLFCLGDVNLDYSPSEMVQALGRDMVQTRGCLSLSNINPEAATQAAQLAAQK